MSTRLQPVDTLPAPDIGAPHPVVVASEGEAIVVYTASSGRLTAVQFMGLYALQFGPPNDEAISGHPLAPFGLRSYGCYLVLDSPWLSHLETMNAVHPHHRPGFLKSYQHIVLTFHDTLLECAAQSFQVVPAESARQLVPVATTAT